MIDVDRLRISFTNTLLLCLGIAWGTAGPAAACTTVLVGRLATVDGSVLMASSCDGDVMGVIHVVPAQSYPPDTKLPMYRNLMYKYLVGDAELAPQSLPHIAPPTIPDFSK